MSAATITIITCPAKDPDTLEEMSLQQRREDSGGWKVFPLRSGRFIDSFLMLATGADFGVFDSDELLTDKDGTRVKTCMIVEAGLATVIPDLAALVEANPSETARALVAHGGGRADVARVTGALTSGAWPESGDPAEEAAAFAHHLLKYARTAKGDLMGVCWEFRGDVTL